MAWLASAPAAAFEQVTVTFAASDGVQVTGTLFLPSGKSLPAVILVPMATRTRADWDATAGRLAEAGMAALAIDVRRSGAPGAVPPKRAGDEEGFDVTDIALDVEAAHTYLIARGEIAPGRIGILGASLGANLAALVGSNVATIRSIALLSPSLEYRGLLIEPPMRKYGKRPALVVVSDDDPYALRTGHQMTAFGDGLRELKIVSGAGHGTVMLGRQSDLIGALVDWFQRTLV